MECTRFSLPVLFSSNSGPTAVLILDAVPQLLIKLSMLCKYLAVNITISIAFNFKLGKTKIFKIKSCLIWKLIKKIPSNFRCIKDYHNLVVVLLKMAQPN